jgi:hypothetical protein
MKKKHFFLGGIVVVALAVIIALVGGKIHRDNSDNGELSADSDSNRVSSYTDADDYYWDDYDDTAAANSPSRNNSGAHRITITGINGIIGNSNISVYDDDGSWVAYGTNTFWDDTAEYPLYDSGHGVELFTGSGSYIIGLTFENDVGRYYYTMGETLAKLEVHSVDDISKLPKFSFDSAESTIPFSHFKPLDYIGPGGK